MKNMRAPEYLIKFETSLKAKITQLKPSYFEHIIRDSLEKTIILENIEGSRKEED